MKKLDNLELEHLNTCIRLFILLYADDTVIFSETLDELQKALGSFEAYCKLWKLEVNVNKTKMLYFLKERLNIVEKLRYSTQLLRSKTHTLI